MVDIRKLSHEDVLKLLPDRDDYAHKGDFGRVLLLCGSRGYTGAAYLAAMGALRCGSGLVYLGVPESIYTIEAVKLNEPVVFPLPDRNGMLSIAAIGEILEKLPCMDAVLIGCGLGQSEDTLAVVQAVLTHARVPVVVDADGINLLGQHKDTLRGRTAPTVLTPHAGEYRRFAAEADPEELARELGCILLMKGHRTRILDGKTCYINTTGNPGMAVGGCGDLLSGMIVSLIGQGIAPLEAAAMAAWLHGAAGDLCAEKLGQYAMLPTDMLEVLPRLLK
jgi:NAD(P)H-hydrate epimerase